MNQQTTEPRVDLFVSARAWLGSSDLTEKQEVAANEPNGGVSAACLGAQSRDAVALGADRRFLAPRGGGTRKKAIAKISALSCPLP
jgi:hypothetical protein